MRRLIARNLKQRIVQVVALAVAVAVSVMAFVSLFLLYGGVSRGVQLNGERSGAQLLVVPSDAEDMVEDTDLLFTGAPVGAYMPASIADGIAGVEGVKRVTVQFYGQTLTESCCSVSAATRIVGFDPQTDWVILPYTDRDISQGIADDQVVLGCNITSFENGEGTVLGQSVHVAAVLAATGTYLDNSILMNLNAIRNLSSQNSQFDHYWEKYGQPEDLVSAVLVQTAEGEQESLAGRLQRRVDGDFSVIVRSDVVAQSQESLSTAFAIMLVAGIAIAIASLLQFVARFSSLVWDRRSELALYRALGATVGDLRKIICGEAFATAGIGCIIGVAAGCALYAALLSFLNSSGSFPFSALPIQIAIGGVLAVVAVVFVVSFLAIIAPLRQVARIDPASAMQQVDIG